ncbi:MAG: tetratricopeptide repeat protein [Candidatus Hermodarchaeota archaeon]
MSHPELKQLTRAEELANAGKLDEALEILNDKSQFEGLNSQQKCYFQFLKGLVLFYMYKSADLIKFGEELFKEGQNFNKNLQSFDGLFFNGIGLAQAYRFYEALEKIEQAENMLKNLSQIPQKDLKLRRARINVLKGWCNIDIGKIDLAEKLLGETIRLEKELGKTFEIVWANIMMGRVMFQGKSLFDLAIEYTKKALSIAMDIKFNHFWIGFCELGFGVRYSSIGDLNRSLKYHMRSLAIFKEIKNHWFTASTLLNIGGLYYELGDYDLSLKYWEESLLLYEIESISVEWPLGNLIEVALEKGDNELAQNYFNQLEELYSQKKDAIIVLTYKLSKALMLKRSSRIRDKAKAEELLKQVVETETIWVDSTITALVHLCDLLFSEYRLNYNNEVLDELNHYIAKLLNIAEKQHSYLVFCKTFILKAKLALINFDVKAARRFLTEAQKIAEKYGIKHLAMKISREHDELLKQIKIWKNLKESEAPLSERLKQAGLDGDIRHMIRKQMVEDSKLSDEDPVLLLIISEGGIPLFSHSFIEEKSIDSEIFSGFLTTIDYFIKEMFSEGLDRAIFGEHTLLMKSIPPFIISYIFKGDSYYALQKTDRFIEHVQTEGNIWQKLLKYSEISQVVYLKDIPSLEYLITETFIK